jgi:hypothetical protein
MSRDQQDNRKEQQQNDVTQNQNPTLQDPGASSVADYGRSEQNLEESKQEPDPGKDNAGIPMHNEDTLGNP